MGDQQLEALEKPISAVLEVLGVLRNFSIRASPVLYVILKRQQVAKLHVLIAK